MTLQQLASSLQCWGSPLSRLQRIVRRTPSKAGGLDHITNDMLKAAPAEALQELANLLHTCKCEGRWPQLRLRLVALLPKNLMYKDP